MLPIAVTGIWFWLEFSKSNDKLGDCIRISGNTTRVIPTLVSSLEEADVRIVLHVSHAVDNTYKHAVIVSSDLDVVALVVEL